MSSFEHHPRLTKIPGEMPKAKPECYAEDIKKMTMPKLLEYRDRQAKLAANMQRLSKLPDKGERVKAVYERILREIAHRDEVQKAADLFSDLNIATTGQQKLTNLEWTGKLEVDRGEEILDSDDDEAEIDPLKIIAQGCTTEKLVRQVKCEKSLITEDDLKEIHSFERRKLNGSVSSLTSSTASNELEPHALYLIDKAVDHLPSTEKFKPYKTTKSNVHDPEKEKFRKLKHWENTAATPPSIIHPGVKMLSLQESIEVQFEYEQRVKRMQEKHAQERLAAKLAQSSEHNAMLPDETARKINQFFQTYRTRLDEDSESEQEDHQSPIYSEDEVADDVDERGTVTFNVQR